MSRRYTPQEKADALQRLDTNFGDITVTSIQTSIPARTLRGWRKQRGLEAVQSDQLPPQNHRRRRQQTSDEDDQENPFNRLREELMQHIFDLSATLMDEPSIAYMRARTLTRLIDRVIRLETVIEKNDKDLNITVVYEHPDGSLKPYPRHGPRSSQNDTDNT